MTHKQLWPAPERNKGPILEVLRRVLPPRGTVLEIACGSGQHAAFFAAELPQLVWLPTDVDEANLASTRAWVADAGLVNLPAPRALDVTSEDWQLDAVEAIFNANMIHIAPWEATLGLLRGASRVLTAQGVLVLYGPFSVDGQHTSDSNARFDADLKARDPRWGVRDVADVTHAARSYGLALRERVPMPANNQMLIFSRAEGSQG